MAQDNMRSNYTYQYNGLIDFPVMLSDGSSKLHLDYIADEAESVAGFQKDAVKEPVADDLGNIVDRMSVLGRNPTSFGNEWERDVKVSDMNADAGSSADSRKTSLGPSQSSELGSEVRVPSLAGSSYYSDSAEGDDSRQIASAALQQQNKILTAELEAMRAELSKTQQTLEKCAENSRNTRKELYKSKAAARKTAREVRDLQFDLEHERGRADIADQRVESLEMRLEAEKILRCTRISIIQSTKATIKKQESQLQDQDQELKWKDSMIQKLQEREEATSFFTGALREKVEEHQAAALRMRAMLEDVEETSFNLLGFIEG